MPTSHRTRGPAPVRGGGTGKLWYLIYLAIAVAILLELAFRGYFAYQVGPRVLVYGTPWYRNALGEYRQDKLIEKYDREAVTWNEKEKAIDSVTNHDDARGGYLKFFPNETKYYKDIDTGEIVPVTINSHGFRGKDYTVAKPQNVIRVLTLGASSTFGFSNPDDQTYPYLLEQRLNRACPGPKRFEVINFAIPHAGAEQIRAMFLAEGLALQPDVITFYEGRNDSNRIHPMEFRRSTGRTGSDAGGFLTSVTATLTETFILPRLLEELFGSATEVSADSALESLETVGARTSRAFLADLEEIRLLAKQRNIVFIVANQQANSKSWFGIPRAERMPMAGVTYGDEVAQINRILRRGEPISGYEFNFLIHARLMRDLKAWSHQKAVPFVDIIGELDQQRHHLVSWVHLDGYANGLVAEAFADEIRRHQCLDAPVATSQIPSAARH